VISNSLEIPIVQYLRRAVPRPEVLLSTEKASSLKEVNLRDMFKKASKTVCTSTIVASPKPMLICQYITPKTTVFYLIYSWFI